MSVGGSKIHERLAHFFIDIYTLEISRGIFKKVRSFFRSFQKVIN